MNDILVHLSSSQREVLLQSVARGSKIWNRLRRAVHVTGLILAAGEIEYIIVCDPAGAEALLHVARRNCPDAVKNIELATRTALRHRAVHHAPQFQSV